MADIKTIAIAAVAGIVAAIACFGGGIITERARNSRIPHESPQVDTLYAHDTITLTTAKETRIPRGWELMPAGTSEKLASYEELVSLYKDSLGRKPVVVEIRDTTYIAVPITEHTFTDDKTYSCGVSGYDVKMLWHKSYQTTAYIPTTAYRPYKWTAFPFVEVGVGSDFIAASAGVGLDLDMSANDRWRFVPELGYNWLYANGRMRHGFYGSAKIKFNLIQAK